MSCINCTGAIDQKKAQDEETIRLAKDKAKREGITYALYRNESGEVCLIPATEASGYPIFQHITSYV